MMFGVVNNNCEAIIKVAVGRIGSPKITVDAVIDTGFTSFLSLPLPIITDLDLPWHFRDIGTLGDGSEVVFEIYKAAVKRLCCRSDLSNFFWRGFLVGRQLLACKLARP